MSYDKLPPGMYAGYAATQPYAPPGKGPASEAPDEGDRLGTVSFVLAIVGIFGGCGFSIAAIVMGWIAVARNPASRLAKAGIWTGLGAIFLHGLIGIAALVVLIAIGRTSNSTRDPKIVRHEFGFEPPNYSVPAYEPPKFEPPKFEPRRFEPSMPPMPAFDPPSIPESPRLTPPSVPRPDFPTRRRPGFPYDPSGDLPGTPGGSNASPEFETVDTLTEAP